MDDIALRLAKANAVIGAERALRSKAEHELRMAQMEVRRLRRAVVALQRQAHTRDKGEDADAGSRSARDQISSQA